jgi:hypoxanthine-DNA glycosylase
MVSESAKDDTARVVGFNPVARSDARVLILGTAPSVLSLRQHQYYGNPRNAFWRIMARLLSRPENEDYETRTRMVLEARIALWDVLASAERPGSLDADINMATAEPNGFAAFFSDHQEVRAVFFNGGPAHKLWKRHVAQDVELPKGTSLVILPSTSPANATLTLEKKIAAWRQVVEAASR